MLLYLGTEAYPRGRRGQIANLLVGVSSSKSSNLFASAMFLASGWYENIGLFCFAAFADEKRSLLTKEVPFFMLIHKRKNKRSFSQRMPTWWKSEEHDGFQELLKPTNIDHPYIHGISHFYSFFSKTTIRFYSFFGKTSIRFYSFFVWKQKINRHNIIDGILFWRRLCLKERLIKNF